MSDYEYLSTLDQQRQACVEVVDVDTIRVDVRQLCGDEYETFDVQHVGTIESANRVLALYKLPKLSTFSY